MLLFGRNNSSEIRSLLKFEAKRMSALAADLAVLAEKSSLDPTDASFPESPPILDFWKLGHRGSRCLIGLSSDHPILYGKSREIITSDLVAISEDLGWARTLSRWYRLGSRAENGKPS